MTEERASSSSEAVRRSPRLHASGIWGRMVGVPLTSPDSHVWLSYAVFSRCLCPMNQNSAEFGSCDDVMSCGRRRSCQRSVGATARPSSALYLLAPYEWLLLKMHTGASILAMVAPTGSPSHFVTVLSIDDGSAAQLDGMDTGTTGRASRQQSGALATTRSVAESIGRVWVLLLASGSAVPGCGESTAQAAWATGGRGSPLPTEACTPCPWPGRLCF